MTQATDQDIRELKSSIDANTRSIDSLVKQTDANTKSIDALAQGTAANTKAIADLVASVSGLREEMRVGFAQVDVKFSQVDIKFAELEGRIDTKLAKLEGKIDVIDERTKLGFWGFIGRAVIVAMFTTLIAIAIRYVVTGKVL
jgi:predicted  nucleic acid-binding Zn-ribbon protein